MTILHELFLDDDTDLGFTPCADCEGTGKLDNGTRCECGCAGVKSDARSEYQLAWRWARQTSDTRNRKRHSPIAWTAETSDMQRKAICHLERRNYAAGYVEKFGQRLPSQYAHKISMKIARYMQMRAMETAFDEMAQEYRAETLDGYLARVGAA